MSRPVGYPKTGGRIKGTPNKNSGVVKELLAAGGFDPIKNLISNYDSLPIELKVKVDIKLLEFMFPKPKELESESELEETHKPNLSLLSDDELNQIAEAFHREDSISGAKAGEEKPRFWLGLIKQYQPQLLKEI